MKRYKRNLDIGDEGITKRTAQRQKAAINEEENFDEVKCAHQYMSILISYICIINWMNVFLQVQSIDSLHEDVAEASTINEDILQAENNNEVTVSITSASIKLLSTNQLQVISLKSSNIVF